MKAALIGSAAYREIYDDFQDVDLLADHAFATLLLFQHPAESIQELPLATNYVIKIDDVIVEVRVPKPETAHAKVLELAIGQIEILGLKVSQVPLPMLCALKKAHLSSPHKWDRHIQQYSRIKGLLGIDVFKPSEWGSQVEAVYRQHRAEIKQFAKPHPKLNTNKNYFFEDADYKVFDHDTIHQAIALGPLPAYTLMQDGEVWCSKEKWDNLTQEQKLNCVKEEASVLALERSIIPALFLGKAFRGAQWAYEYALGKVCTTITSGWFREFAIEHYEIAVQDRPDFVSMFFDGVKNKTVKLLKPELVGELEKSNA